MEMIVACVSCHVLYMGLGRRSMAIPLLLLPQLDEYEVPRDVSLVTPTSCSVSWLRLKKEPGVQYDWARPRCEGNSKRAEEE